MTFSLSEFEPVADRVYRAVAEPEAVNLGLVVGTTGALVVDTGSSPAQGRAVREAAQRVAGPVPLTHVVVTHAHYDHLFGLAAFADLDTLGHRGLADSVRRHPPAPAELEAAGLDPVPSDPAEVPLPARTFGLATTVDLGDCYVEIVHFGRGHTDHDVVVLVPGRGVVFAGDLLESSAPPSVGPDSHLSEWPKTLDGLLGTLRPAAVVVPGHGEPMDRTAAFMQRAELAYRADEARIAAAEAASGPRRTLPLL